MLGLGFGLIYLPAIVSVAQYFEKRRAFATGLAVCGSGFGTFLMAPITELLLQEFGWRGALLILGGVILNVVVCGAVFRPLESSAGGKQDTEKGEGGGAVESLLEREALLENTANGGAAENEPSQEQAGVELRLDQLSNEEGGGDVSTLPIRSVTREQLEWISNSQSHLSPPSNGLVHVDVASIAKSDGALHHLNKLTATPAAKARSLSRQSSGTGPVPSAVRSIIRKDLFYTASLQNIPMFRSHHDLYITSITSLPDVSHPYVETGALVGVHVSGWEWGGGGG